MKTANTKKPTTVKRWDDGQEVSISKMQETLREFPQTFRACLDDYGKPGILNAVSQTDDLGCNVEGNGTLAFPLRVKHSKLTEAAPELLNALQKCIPFLEQDLVMLMAADAGNENALFNARKAIQKATE